MTERQAELGREKARRLRYKRPAAKGLTLYEMRERLSDIQAEAADLGDLLWDDDMLEEVLGSEEDAFEFRLAFADLRSDCEQMEEALDALGDLFYISDDEAGEIFERFFPAVRDDRDLYGFDAAEGDFYPLTYWETDAAEKAARERIKKLTKDQLLDAAGAACRILRQYLALDYRHECLSAALEVLHGKQDELIRITQEIERLYEAAETASDGFKWDFSREIRELDQALSQLPERVWIE